MSGKERPSIQMGPVVMDCGAGQAAVLSEFYSLLLDWELSHPAQNGTAAITSPEGKVLAFQETETYQAPVWPWKPGTQGQMVHFDTVVRQARNPQLFPGKICTEARSRSRRA